MILYLKISLKQLNLLKDLIPLNRMHKLSLFIVTFFYLLVPKFSLHFSY